MKFICLAIVGLVAARLSLAASVNNPFPYFFSGTACRATGSLGSIPIAGFPYLMKLWIGGELAAYWESGDPFAPVLALASPDESASNSNDLVSRLRQQNSP